MLSSAWMHTKLTGHCIWCICFIMMYRIMFISAANGSVLPKFDGDRSLGVVRRCPYRPLSDAAGTYPSYLGWPDWCRSASSSRGRPTRGTGRDRAGCGTRGRASSATLCNCDSQRRADVPWRRALKKHFENFLWELLKTLFWKPAQCSVNFVIYSGAREQFFVQSEEYLIFE